ncbi:MAG: hypothetical protein Q4C85_04685 [Actinomyces sp.]|uniref:hypothetical protein n=1 Tax=Actinomyces sp. TaxID=29317 RepID=UPI0026DD56DF|nr:hypothetical protein [Actinomyces sp.]MDO4243046.1 hypothetical protein [Actinomyces sp.]
MSTLDLPVSVLLALWAPLPSSRGAQVVQGPDGAHTVSDDAAPWGLGRLDLGAWLHELGPLLRAGALLVSPADPVPGLREALDAGEAVVLETAQGRRMLLVPRRNGTSVTWEVTEQDIAVAPTDPTYARREVHQATEQAIDALVELDLARERPDLADELSDLITAVTDPRLIPPTLEPRRRTLLERSLRLEAICATALSDDGAAVSAVQAQRRQGALRPLRVVARRGVGAATQWWAG